MGNIFCKNKTGLALILLWLFILYTAPHLQASYSEFDLFNKGYEKYISYEPQEAIKIFKTFLKEFPQSSATDAVMFWLAKSLIQIKSFDEANEVFSDLKKRFPESPFLPFIDKELEKLKEFSIEAQKEKESETIEQVYTSEAYKKQLEELKENLKMQEDKLKEIIEDKEILKSKLTEKEKKVEELQARLTDLEQIERVKQNLMDEVSSSKKEKDAISRLFEEEKTKTEELNRMLKDYQMAEDKYLKEIDELRFKLEEEKNENNILLTKVKEYEEKIIEGQVLKEEITKEKETLEALLKEANLKIEALESRIVELEKSKDFVINPTFVLNKLGIRDILWRNGNIEEDFMTEQILYEKAMDAGINFDETQYEKLLKKYNLSNGQAEYLKKYLIISKLIDQRLKDIGEEKFVDILSVQYEDKKEEKIILSREILSHAGNGMSFNEIHERYFDSTKFETIPFHELEDWIKERIKLLKNEQIEIIWLKDGYMIIKPISKRLSYDPFKEPPPTIKKMIRIFIKKWIDELKES